MHHTYILDTNVIIRNSKILTQRYDNATLVVPRIVIKEIENLSARRGDFSALPSLIENAHKKKHIIIGEHDQSLINNIITASHSLADAIILNYAKEMAQDTDNIILVTNDFKLNQKANSEGIFSINSTQLLLALIPLGEIDSESQKLSNSFINSQLTNILVSLLFGIIGSLIADLGFSKLQLIFNWLSSTFKIWGTVLIILASGIILYAIRSRWRLRYGVFEFSIGAITAIRVFWPDFDFNNVNPSFAFFQILGGLYIMVRGLDNIGKALSGTPFEGYWIILEGKNNA